jgi:hypothetical protein
VKSDRDHGVLRKIAKAFYPNAHSIYSWSVSTDNLVVNNWLLMELAANFLLPRKLPCHAKAEKVKKTRNQRWSRKLESGQPEEGMEGETHQT